MMLKPMIGEAILRRHGKGPLKGPITPGEVFAWEPDLPHARELCIVRRIYPVQKAPGWTEIWVEAWDMDYAHTFNNEEARFREACVRTSFNLFPAEKPRMVLSPLPEGIFALKRAS